MTQESTQRYYATFEPEALESALARFPGGVKS
jgi:hypothetical protein